MDDEMNSSRMGRPPSSNQGMELKVEATLEDIPLDKLLGRSVFRPLSLDDSLDSTRRVRMLQVTISLQPDPVSA